MRRGSTLERGRTSPIFAGFGRITAPPPRTRAAASRFTNRLRRHGREVALLADPAKGGALFRGGAGGLGNRLLRLRSRRLRRRRGGRGPCGPGLRGAHPRLPQEGVPLLLCAVEG